MLKLETNCIGVRFGHGLLVQDLKGEMTEEILYNSTDQ